MRWKNEKGQSIVEFAIILPILILLLSAIIDFGWLYNGVIATNNAVREAARYTSIHIYDSSIDDDLAAARAIVLAEAVQLPADGTTVTLTFVDVDTDGINESVKISAEASVDLLTGVTSTLLGRSSINVSASSIMKIEN